MSNERLRQLKLYKKLQKDMNYRERLQDKIRQISSTNPSLQSFKITKKLNNNKKYFQQQEKNLQIQRQNRILFEKIQAQATKNPYYKRTRSKNRSSKTLNQMEDDGYSDKQRKNYNCSQNRIHFQQQQSRISFQQNQQLLKPKKYKQKQRILTQLSPEVAEIFQSRMIENKIKSHETVLFQGIAEIDSIRFKVKISIKEKIYSLAGKNKHTDILLKMELDEYRKFHKQVLMGNPSSIFQYLIIDKGQIKFRTATQQSIYDNSRQKIFQIEEQQEQNQETYKKYKQTKKIYQHQQINNEESQRRNLIKLPKQQIHYQKQSKQSQFRRSKQTNSMEKLLYKKENIQIQANSNPHIRVKPNHYDKIRTLEDYINDKDHYHHKDFESGQSTGIQAKYIKNRYKLPYL